jgi:hypothetical protein
MDAKNVISSSAYQTYIKSERWQQIRAWAIEAARSRCQRCDVLMLPGAIQVHHLHYQTLGREMPGDIQVLCGNCHVAVTENQRKDRQEWGRRKDLRKQMERDWARLVKWGNGEWGNGWWTQLSDEDLFNTYQEFRQVTAPTGTEPRETPNNPATPTPA